MADFANFSLEAIESNPLIGQMSFIHKPQVGRELFDVQPMETDTGDLMRMGLVKEVMGEELIHHEANKRFDAPRLNVSATATDVFGTASVGNGDPALFDGLDYVQLHADSHTPKDGSDAGKYSYPREGNLIQFSNLGTWRVQGKRETTASQHRLYLKKVNATVPDLSATVTTGASNGGDYFSVFTTAWEEASFGQKKGLVPSFTVVKNYLQTFRDYYEITDFAERDQTYPLNFHGRTINFVYNKGVSDTEMRFAAQEDFGLFLSPKDDGTLDHLYADGTTAKVTTTHGFMPQLEDNAQKMVYDTNPTVNLFEDIIRIRRKRHQGNRAFMFMGFEFELRLKDVIHQFVQDTGTRYNTKDFDLNIRTIKIGTFTFDLKHLRTLNHPDVTAIAGFPYPHYFIVCPTDKTKDPKTNIMEYSFCVNYKRATGKGARGHYKMWETGGNSQAGTDEQATRRIHLYCRKGMKVVGASNFILGKRSA